MVTRFSATHMETHPLTLPVVLENKATNTFPN